MLELAYVHLMNSEWSAVFISKLYFWLFDFNSVSTSDESS